jgi:hypothetical protein
MIPRATGFWCSQNSVAPSAQRRRWGPDATTSASGEAMVSQLRPVSFRVDKTPNRLDVFGRYETARHYAVRVRSCRKVCSRDYRLHRQRQTGLDMCCVQRSD